MEQLDLVHKVLTNLEKNYKLSKKTRSEYVKEKFGGDIGMGSFLILNALSAEELTDPEDIKKLSEVQNVIEFLVSNEENLDFLSSFEVSDNVNLEETLFRALNLGELEGTGITVASQAEIYKARRGLHYYITAKKSVVASQDTCQYFHIFNDAMRALMAPTCNDHIVVGNYLQRGNVGFSCKRVSKVKL